MSLELMEDTNVTTDVHRLKLIISDLNRRLQNAQLTVQAERNIARNATAQAEFYRIRIGDISNSLRIETSKNINLERRKIRETESSKFESNKLRAATLHEELRMMELDHLMTKFKKEPLKLTRLRAKVESLEQEQNSQKILLQQLSELDNLNEQLSTAAQHDNVEECIILLKCGASINYVDSAGYIPLHYACANGHFNTVKLLLEFGSDYTSSLTGHSPVIIAAGNGHNHIIKLLLDFGCNIEDKGSGGCSATFIAFQHSRFETLGYLLSLGASVNSVDPNEDTLLHKLVKCSDNPQTVDIMQRLLQRDDVDTSLVNKQSLNPLQLAMYSKNKTAMDILGPVPSSSSGHQYQHQQHQQHNKLGNTDRSTTGSVNSLNGTATTIRHNNNNPIRHNSQGLNRIITGATAIGGGGGGGDLSDGGGGEVLLPPIIPMHRMSAINRLTTTQPILQQQSRLAEGVQQLNVQQPVLTANDDDILGIVGLDNRSTMSLDAVSVASSITNF